MEKPSIMQRTASSTSEYDPAVYDDVMSEEVEHNSASLFDLLDSFVNVPMKLEAIQGKLKERGQLFRENVVKKRVEPLIGKTNKELDRVKLRITRQVDKAQERWKSESAISTREKVAFVLGVGNVFVTALLIGGWPQYLHLLYTTQILVWMPWRYYTYHRTGMHYFIADLCYWVNFLTLLYLWIFPWSEKLLISVFYLSYGSLAWAIVAWRNSLVFHSVDKVTSLFIHIFPPAVMQTVVHVLPREYSSTRFPAVELVGELTFLQSITYSSGFYMIWQALYYVFIQVRRQEKIKAGRPTSFTWLLKSYSKSWLGQQILRLPEFLQPFAFMCIQFGYALVTMAPCKLWLTHRPAAALFLISVFFWSVWNGANYYMEVFAKKYSKELERLKKEIANMEHNTPALTPSVTNKDEFITDLDLNQYKEKDQSQDPVSSTGRRSSSGKSVQIDDRPVTLSETTATPTTSATSETHTALKNRAHKDTAPSIESSVEHSSKSTADL